MILRIVDLPVPEGPMIPTASPRLRGEERAMSEEATWRHDEGANRRAPCAAVGPPSADCEGRNPVMGRFRSSRAPNFEACAIEHLLRSEALRGDGKTFDHVISKCDRCAAAALAFFRSRGETRLHDWSASVLTKQESDKRAAAARPSHLVYVLQLDEHVRILRRPRRLRLGRAEARFLHTFHITQPRGRGAPSTTCDASWDSIIPSDGAAELEARAVVPGESVHPIAAPFPLHTRSHSSGRTCSLCFAPPRQPSRLHLRQLPGRPSKDIF